MSPGQATSCAWDMLLRFLTPSISANMNCPPPGVTIVQEAHVVVNY